MGTNAVKTPEKVTSLPEKPANPTLWQRAFDRKVLIGTGIGVALSIFGAGGIYAAPAVYRWATTPRLDANSEAISEIRLEIDAIRVREQESLRILKELEKRPAPTVDLKPIAQAIGEGFKLSRTDNELTRQQISSAIEVATKQDLELSKQLLTVLEGIDKKMVDPPKPKPDPKPEPKPDDEPSGEKLDKAEVILLRESKDMAKMPLEQRLLLVDGALWGAKNKVAIYDKDAGSDDSAIQAYFAYAEKKGVSLPAVIIMNFDKKDKQPRACEKLPSNKTGASELVSKYVK